MLLVVVDDPRGEYYGATVAAPTFRKVVEEILMIRTRDFENAPPQTDVEFATREKRPEVKPRKALATVSYSTVFEDDSDEAATVTNTVQVAVPNLEGWPLRKAVQELSKRHLSFKLLGSRRVVTQLPAPGTIVLAGTVCELYGE